MVRASDNEFPSVLLDEQASAPTTPATGFWRVYAKSDGLYIIDDAGAETGPFGTGGGGGGSTWTSYTPTWTASTNPSIGNGTLHGAFLESGKTLFFRIHLIMGSTTTFGSGDWFFGLPSGKVAKTGTQQTALAQARDAGTAHRIGACRILSAATSFEVVVNGGARWSSSIPQTWANTDEIDINGVIEID